MTTDDYPDIRRRFAEEWRVKSRRLLPERDDIPALKAKHNERLEAALTKARNEDAAIRERTGTEGASGRIITALQQRDARRDRRQGFEGDDVITHDLLDRVDSDLAHIGQIRDETVAEFERRLTAQFPSEASPYAGKSGSLRAMLALKARQRGRSVGVGNA